MAVFNVANMLQFNDAIKNCADGDTIEILADLDWNDVATDVTQSIILGNSSSVSFTTNGITINGNNHAIYNLSGNLIRGGTYGTHVFDFHGAKANINNVSFLNCDFGFKDSDIIYSSGNTTNIQINDCVFQGRFKYAPFKRGGANSGTIQLNRCMFTCNFSDVSPFKTATGGAPSLWSYCWIKLTDYNAFNAGSGSTYAENLFGCYIEGKLNYVSSSATNLRIFRYLQNCCINLEFNVQQTTDPDVFVTPINSATAKNVINIDKISTDAGYSITEASSTNINKCVTDAHMKDASYLASVGFDIIV